MRFFSRHLASFTRGVLLVLLFALLTGHAEAFDRVWLKNPEAVSSGTTTRFIAALANGDVIVGGKSGSSATQDYLVYRLSGADGSTVWRRAVDSASGDDINDLIADPATGDTYFCGRTSVSGQGLNWYVMKLNGADGTNAWSSPYTYTTSGANNDEPRSLSFVADGGTTNLVVVGMQSPGGMPSGYVIKLNASTGASMWTASPTPQCWVVRTDSSGGIFVGGETFAASNAAGILKFNVSGTQQWYQTYAPNGGSFNRWNYLALDPVSGDAIVAGLIGGPSGASSINDIGVARYKSSDGTRLWTRLINGGLNDNDSANGVIVDNGGDAYVLGSIRHASATGADWYIGRVALADGTVTWSQSHTGNTGTTGDIVNNIQVVGSTLYVAGYLTNSSPGRTSVVMTLNKSDGSTIERTDFTDRVGGQIVGTRALVVTSNGEMIVASDSGATTGQGEIIRYGDAATAPTVTTSTQASVAATSATLGGNVTAAGSASVTDRGIVWATTATPTTANNKVSIGSGTGAFSQSVTGLPSSTPLYVRAFATSSAGTSYGSQVSFTTLTPDTTPPTVTSVVRLTPANQTIGAATTYVVFRVTYSESVTNVATANFAVEAVNGGTVNGSVTNVAGSGATRDVTVSITSGYGEFRLNVISLALEP